MTDSVADLRRKFNQIDRALGGRGILTALEVAALPIMNEAKRRAAYKRGDLRRSITTRRLGDHLVGVGTDEPYAARIEYGFDGADSLGRVFAQAAQPYMRPAYETKRREAVQEFGKAVKELILNAAR